MADKFEKMNKPNNIEIKTEIKNLALIKFLGEISKSTSKPVVISQIINTKYLYEILTEADYDYFFKNLNFTFDKSIGILNTEITEIISFLIKYVEKVCPELNHEFNNLKNINVANLLKKDSSEIDKLVDLLIISILNCNNKETFIDKLLNMEEYVQQEILNIIEIYVNVDERESIKNTMNKSIHKGGFMFSTNFNQENDESIANINQIHQNLEFSMLNSEVNRLKQENTELKMFIELHEDNIRELDKKVLTLSIENKNLETENIRMSNELKTKNKDISTEIKQKIENLEALLKSKELENKKLTLNYENKLQEKKIN